MAPGFALNLFLLSPALHWAVLINTNGWYGCEELKSRRYSQVRNATNFASRLRGSQADVQPACRCEQKAPLLTAFKDLIVQTGFRAISKS